MKASYKKKSSEKVMTGTFVDGVKNSSGQKKGQFGGGPMRNSRKKKECVFRGGDTHNTQDCPRFTFLKHPRYNYTDELGT